MLIRILSAIVMCLSSIALGYWYGVKKQEIMREVVFLVGTGTAKKCEAWDKLNDGIKAMAIKYSENDVYKSLLELIKELELEISKAEASDVREYCKHMVPASKNEDSEEL